MHIRIYRYRYIYTHVDIYRYIYGNVHVYKYLHIYSFIRIYSHVDVSICTCIYIHKHIYKRKACVYKGTVCSVLHAFSARKFHIDVKVR